MKINKNIDNNTYVFYIFLIINDPHLISVIITPLQVGAYKSCVLNLLQI